MSTIPREVDTWESEARPVKRRAPLKPTAKEEQRAGPKSSSRLSLRMQRWKVDENEEGRSKFQQRITDTQPSGLRAVSSYLKASQKAASGPLSLAPTGLGTSKGAFENADNEHVTTAVQNDEQSVKVSKRLSITPVQELAEKSEVGGPQDVVFASQKDQCSTMAISEKNEATKELTQAAEPKGSREYEETYVMPGASSLHLEQSVNRGEISASIAGKETYENALSAKVEAPCQDAPPNRDDDDADKANPPAQNVPEAKDDGFDRQGFEENAKKGADQSDKESTERNDEENGEQDKADKPAPSEEAPSEGDNERNDGSGEPLELQQAAGATPAADNEPTAEIRKQELEGFTCTLYPESRFAIIIGLVCLIWISVVYFLASPKDQFDQTTEFSDSTRTPLTFPAQVETTMTALTGTVTKTTTHSEVPFNIYICSTDRCIDEGERLRQYITEQISPCDNFYQYVCSGWELDTPLRDFGQGIAISTDVFLEEKMAKALRDYILDERNVDVGATRMLYKACLRPAGNSFALLQREVFATLPVRTWPYSGTHMQSNDIWELAGTLLRRYGIVSILDVTIGVLRGHDDKTIELCYPRHLLKGDYANAEVLETFRSAVFEAAEEFGWSSAAESLISQVISVAQNLALLMDDVSSWDVQVWKFR
ncbi:hypothetical protein MRX96_029134 [Rhipicephalus microplus]